MIFFKVCFSLIFLVLVRENDPNCCNNCTRTATNLGLSCKMNKYNTVNFFDDQKVILGNLRKLVYLQEMASFFYLIRGKC